MRTDESVEGPADDRHQSMVEGQAKAGNHEIPEKGEEVGLVELVLPMERDQIRGRERSLQTATRGRGGLRAELVEVLEQFGISVAGFDRLRRDAFEKHVAARSLAELAGFYEAILDPGLGLKEMQAVCPAWQGKHGDKKPSLETLREIKERITMERSVREHLAAKGLIAARKAEGFHDDEEQFFNETLEILAEELLAAKAKGKPISENLKIVDRLLKSAMLGVRQQRENREDARLEWIKAGQPIVRPEPVGPVKPQETVDQMFERVYGRNPFKKEAEKTSVISGPNLNNQDAKAQNTKFQNPESKLQGNQPNAEGGVRADDGQQSGNGGKAEGNSTPHPNPLLPQSRDGEGEEVVGCTRPGTVESPGDDCQQSKVEGQAEEKAAAPVDTRPEWAKKPGNYLIGAPCKWHPAGIKKYKNKAVDALTEAVIRDMNWETFIGFGGDGEKVLN